MPTQVLMPELGESVEEATVTRWLKQEGDSVTEFEPLLEVNTDKVDTEIPSPATGIVLKILVGENTTVNKGQSLAWIGQPGETLPGHAEAPLTAQDAPTPEPPQPLPPSTAPPGREPNPGFIPPVAARLVRKHHRH